MAKLVFKVESDVQKVIQLREEINRLKAELKNVNPVQNQAQFNAINEKLQTTSREFNQVTSKAAQASAVMGGELKQKIYAAAQSVNDFTEKIIAQKAVVRDVQADVKRLGDAYKEAKKNNPMYADAKFADFKSARKALDEERAALFHLTQEQANARLSVKRLNDEYKLLKDDGKEAVVSLDGAMSGLKQTMIGLVGGMGLKEFVGQVMNVRMEFENMETSLRSLVGGSEEKMRSLMKQIQEYALISPLNTKDMLGSLQTMIGFGLDPDSSVKYLKAIGDISMGDAQKFNSLSLAFSQCSAAGKLMGQDLNQMINQGFNPLSVIADKTGKSVGQLKEEMSKGKIFAEMVQQAFIDATSEGGKFYGMAEAGSKTLSGQISMLEENIDLALNDIGKSTEGIAFGAIGVLQTLTEHWQEVGKIILTVASAYGVYKGVLLAAMVSQRLQNANLKTTKFLKLENAAATTTAATAEVGATTATTGLAGALNTLKVAIATNPIGIFAAALTTIVGVIWSLNSEVETASEIQEKFGESANKSTEKMLSLYNIVQVTSKESKVHRDSLNELVDMYEEYGIKLEKVTEDGKNEQKVLDDVVKFHDRVTESIRNECVERERANALQAAYDTYAASMKQAVADLKEDLGGVFDDESITNGLMAAIQQLTSPEELQKLEQLRIAWNNALNAKGWDSAETQAAVQAYQAEVDRLGSKVELAGKKIGATSGQIKLAKNSLYNYTIAATDAKIKLNKTETAVNTASDAVEQMGATANAQQSKLRALGNQFMAAGDNVHTLYQRVREFMQKYGDTHANFTIDFNANVPKWMLSKNIAELGRLGKFWAALAAEMARTGKKTQNVNGKIFTFKQVMQNADNYSHAADIKQTQKDIKAKKEKERKEKERENKKIKKSKKKGKTKEQIEKERERKEDEARKLAEQQREYEELKKQQEKEKERADIELEFARREAENKTLKDGNEKTLKQLKLNFDKQEYEIRKGYEDLKRAKIEKAEQLFKANPANAKKLFDPNSVDTSYTAAETANFNAQIDAILAEYNKGVEEVHKKQEEELNKQKSALTAYLKDYGSMQEQRLAIAEEYAQKIAKAETEGERLSLQAQRDKALQDFDFKEFKEGIDWEGIFGNLSNMTREKLEEVKGQLREMLNSKDLSIEDYKTAVDQIDKVNSAIVEQEERQHKFLGISVPINKERRKIELDIADAKERQADAAEKEKEAISKQQSSQIFLENVLSNLGVDYKSFDISKSDETLSKFDKESEDYKLLQAAIEDLAEKTIEATEATKKRTKADNNLANAKGKDTKKAAGIMGDWFGVAAEDLKNFHETADTVISNLNDLPDLLETFGVAKDSDVGMAVGSFVDGANSGMDAFKDFENGNYVGALMNSLNAIDSFGDIFGFGDSDKHLESDLERLAESNEILKQSLDRLSNKMDKASVAESGSVYELQKANLKKQERNLQESMARSAAAHKKGIKGKHSSNWEIGEVMTSADWAAISKAAGRKISRSHEFWSLSAEEMRKVAEEATAEYNKLKGAANDGYRDAAQYMDEYIALADQAEEARKRYQEKLTNVSFDSIVSEFQNALMNMDSSAEDFANNFEKMMINAVIGALISNKYKGKLEAWYKKFADYSESGNELTKEEQERLRNEYKDITKEALEERNRLKDTMQWQGESEQQSGSSRGFATMTQDQASELSGRFTAMQVAMETANVKHDETNAHISLMNSTLEQMKAMQVDFKALDGIRDIQAKSYLELVAIRENTDKMVKPIISMSEGIEEIKRNTSRL